MCTREYIIFLILSRAAINLHQNEKYLINYRHHKINVVLHEGLAPLDLLRAYYHAYYIKTTLFLDGPINSKVKALDDPHWLERVHTWRSVQSGYVLSIQRVLDTLILW